MRTTDNPGFDRAAPSRPDAVSKAILCLASFAVLYNAVLAIVSAHITHVNATEVMATEIMISLIGTGIIALRFDKIGTVWPPFLLFFCVLVTFPLVTILSGDLALKTLRDVYLISLFFLLGCLMDKRDVIILFRVLGILVFLVMLIEAYATPIYAALFRPADYFLYTRGIEESVYNKTGLFANSLGFEGRFNYGVFHTHRLSSLFLEQVSLANFCIVLMLFLSAFWSQLKKAERLCYALLIAFIILTTNSRTASCFVIIILMGHFIFPLLPRYANALFMPLILLVSGFLFYDPLHAVWADDLKGRISHTIDILGALPPSTVFGGDPTSLDKWGDAGFAYIIGSQTVIGLLALWLFITFGMAQNDAAAKRYASGLNLYIFVGLLIGAAIFTIKVAAPSWIVAGWLYQRALKNQNGEPDLFSQKEKT
jgi:hypothetical protein